MIRRLLFLVILAIAGAVIAFQFSMPSLPAPALGVVSWFSPRAAVRGFLDAAQADDEAGMKRFATEGSSDLAGLASKLDWLLDGEWAVGDDITEGDSARVRVKREEDGKEATLLVRKQSGRWRVDLSGTALEWLKGSLLQ